MKSRILFALGSLIFLSLSVGAASGKKIDSLEDLARDAYIWGYPAVHMHNARHDILSKTQAGMNSVNHFFHSSKVPDPFLGQLTAINPENLYSWAWLDLNKEPLVMTQPALPDRYYSVQFVDAYSTVFHTLSSTSQGDKPGAFLITGPEWNGEAPKELKQIRAVTPEILIVAQTFVRNNNDLQKVAKITRQRNLIPFSEWNKGVHTDSFKVTYPTTPLKVNKNLATTGMPFYEELRKIIAINPPPTKADEKELARFTALGLKDGAELQRTLSVPSNHKMMERGIFEGEREIQQRLATGFGTKINGWAYEMKAPAFTEDYSIRAAVAQRYFFSPPPEETIQMILDTDSEGRQLTGAYRYILHFEKDDFPPARSMWSLRVHEMKSKNLDDLTRAISVINDKASSLKSNMDGSMDILLQDAKPAALYRANWLKVSQNANFYVVLTLYNPSNTALNRKYIAPSLTRIDEDSIPKQRITHTMMADATERVSK